MGELAQFEQEGLQVVSGVLLGQWSRLFLGPLLHGCPIRTTGAVGNTGYRYAVPVTDCSSAD